MDNLRRIRGADVPEGSMKASGTSLHPSIATHHVFISHRGIEMKRTFASHLYAALQQRGIKVFLDIVELPPGDDVRPFMLEAARAAIVGVPIFTRNFAESRWCLDELVEMMESSTGTKRSKVIPVFYDVKSEDLRREDGPFARAIQAHREEGKRDEQTIRRWESALREASWLEGFRLETYNGVEAKLIEHLWPKVAEEVQSRIPVDAVPNAVGLQDRVCHVVQRLRLENQDAIYFVLLWGMGGIGKTTLARDIYHTYRHQFQAASFVESWRKGRKSVQDCLRCDLLHHKDVVMRDDIASGRAILQAGLRGKRVLIVLDDMKDFAFIKDVLDPAALHPGSRILVTSRDQSLLPPQNHFTDVFRGELYEVQLLDHEESLRLLCCHAFNKPAPESGFEELAEAVTKACNGLPFSLDLLGCRLSRSRDKEVWQEATKVSRNNSIQDIMMSSYEGLSKEEQAMFLDVACLLIGELESSAKCFWKGLDYAPRSGLKRLIDLSLVKVHKAARYGDGDDGKRLTMHDHLRDFGRSIVRDESEKTGKWSRLWDDSDLSKVLRTKQGLDQVRGIATSNKLNADLLSQMHSLELLFLTTTESLDGDCEGLKLAQIKWLKCTGLDLVKFFEPESLPVLDINRGFWETATRLPSSLGQLKTLKVLKLQMLPEEFGSLESLEELEVDGTGITNLPSSFGQLKRLRVLKMAWCEQLQELLEEFGSLESLEELDVDCTGITNLPSSFGQLKRLRVLKMAWCQQLQELPEEFGSLESLEELDVACTGITNLPSSFGQLKRLQE